MGKDGAEKKEEGERELLFHVSLKNRQKIMRILIRDL